MTFEEVARMLNPDIYRQFKESLALGKWPDGRTMTKEQKEICIQAVMLYEEQQNIAASDRLGFVDTERKTSPCDTPKKGDDDVDKVRILH